MLKWFKEIPDALDEVLAFRITPGDTPGPMPGKEPAKMGHILLSVLEVLIWVGGCLFLAEERILEIVGALLGLMLIWLIAGRVLAQFQAPSAVTTLPFLHAHMIGFWLLAAAVVYWLFVVFVIKDEVQVTNRFWYSSGSCAILIGLALWPVKLGLIKKISYGAALSVSCAAFIGTLSQFF